MENERKDYVLKLMNTKGFFLIIILIFISLWLFTGRLNFGKVKKFKTPVAELEFEKTSSIESASAPRTKYPALWNRSFSPALP